jgi:hypothetical protein
MVERRPVVKVEVGLHFEDNTSGASGPSGHEALGMMPFDRILL